MLPEVMYRRKIQLIAGTTYSLSLPKDWVKKNNLKEKNEVLLYEKGDRSLLVSPHSIEEKKLNEISLNIDKHVKNIDQMLFAIYYMGVENITLFSKKEFTKDIKARIRETLRHMSGTEITYEDKEKIKIKVLLDKSRVDIIQTIYRIVLIIDSSLSNILEGLNIGEIKNNEDELDRLYHLMAKIISLSLIDSNVLHSSKIDHVSLIPSYFLVCKKLENIGDVIEDISEYLKETKVNFENKKEIINIIRTKLNMCASYIINKSSTLFEKTSSEGIKKIFDTISEVKDVALSNHLVRLIRLIKDVEDEMVNISFYKQMIQENVL